MREKTKRTRPLRSEVDSERWAIQADRKRNARERQDNRNNDRERKHA